MPLRFMCTMCRVNLHLMFYIWNNLKLGILCNWKTYFESNIFSSTIFLWRNSCRITMKFWKLDIYALVISVLQIGSKPLIPRIYPISLNFRMFETVHDSNISLYLLQVFKFYDKIFAKAKSTHICKIKWDMLFNRNAAYNHTHNRTKDKRNF